MKAALFGLLILVGLPAWGDESLKTCLDTAPTPITIAQEIPALQKDTNRKEDPLHIKRHGLSIAYRNRMCQISVHLYNYGLSDTATDLLKTDFISNVDIFNTLAEEDAKLPVQQFHVYTIAVNGKTFPANIAFQGVQTLGVMEGYWKNNIIMARANCTRVAKKSDDENATRTLKHMHKSLLAVMAHLDKCVQ